jgi:prevent-host-death family protein
MSSDNVGIEQARKTLGDLVTQVQQTGTAITLTRNGKPAARLTPLEPAMTETGNGLTGALADVELPPGVHAGLAEESDGDTDKKGQMTVVVWADRPSGHCPNCEGRVPVAVTECPVNIHGQNPGMWSQQHGCGEWLPTYAETVTPSEVRAVAERAAAWLTDQRGDLRSEVTDRLKAELREALDTPRDESETHEEWLERAATGTDTEPGVVVNGDELLAWDHDPLSDDGDLIEISESDLG